MKGKVNESHYAYSVTAARIMQRALLSDADYAQLIAAPDAIAALAVLSSKGWKTPDDISLIPQMLDDELQNAWDFLVEFAPDIDIFKPFILRNDYHNLKAALKCALSELQIDRYFIRPALVPRKLMIDALSENRFSLLPEPFSSVLKQAYDALNETRDGQLVDIIIDRAAIDGMIAAAGEIREPLVRRIIDTLCALSNIKIAFRGATLGKNKDFFETAIGNCFSLDRKSLIDASAKGSNELFQYLKTTSYAEHTELLKTSPIDFERHFEDRILSSLEPIRFEALGANPLIAFFLFKEAEIKNIRLILAGKLAQSSGEEIRRRLRRIYV